MKSFNLAAILFILTLIFACSSSQIGNRQVVQTSSEKPEWASDSKVFDRTEKELVFENLKFGRTNLDIAKTEAEAELRLDVAERLSTDISGAFSNAYAANNRAGGMLEEEIAGAVKSTVNKLTVVGFTVTDFYWEKMEVKEEYGVGYLYDVYARGSISINEYNKLYKKALMNLEGSKREDLRNTAKKLLDEL